MLGRAGDLFHGKSRVIQLRCLSLDHFEITDHLLLLEDGLFKLADKSPQSLTILTFCIDKLIQTLSFFNCCNSCFCFDISISFILLKDRSLRFLLGFRLVYLVIT